MVDMKIVTLSLVGAVLMVRLAIASTVLGQDKHDHTFGVDTVGNLTS